MTTLGQSDEYIKMLQMLNDNADGKQAPFSIQNVVRMSLIFDKHPGEWHGNKSISLVFSHLNKIYHPVSQFDICLFGDETIVWDKIEKKASRPQRDWVQKQLSKLETLSEEQQDKVLLIDALFSPYLKTKGQHNFIIEDSGDQPDYRFGQKRDYWLNTVLVIVCCRLGMKQVQPEYLDIIRRFFSHITNVGILGGRPGEAYYLVGLQDEFLIFLDPHNTEDAIPNDPEKIKQHHMGYHESTAKKIHYSKLDPSLGFAFLLRRKSDYDNMKEFVEMGQKLHKKNWIFHAM